jgi:formylmethanofuran dehydrogenase subunit B
LVRYSAFARGRFTEGGLEERRVAAVDIYRTEMAEFCHIFVQMAKAQEVDLLRGVTAALTGGVGPEPRVKGTRRLADMLAKATYGVLFFGRGVGYGPAAVMGELFHLINALQKDKPFFLFPLAGDFNAYGLAHLLLREVGGVSAPQFCLGGEVKLHRSPEDFAQADAVLVAGGDLLWSLRPEQKNVFLQRRIPLVVLSPFSNQTTVRAQVVLPVALEGVETPEVAYRMDGLPVVLRQALAAVVPPAHQVLRDLSKMLGEGTLPQEGDRSDRIRNISAG